LGASVNWGIASDRGRSASRFAKILGFNSLIYDWPRLAEGRGGMRVLDDIGLALYWKKDQNCFGEALAYGGGREPGWAHSVAAKAAGAELLVRLRFDSSPLRQVIAHVVFKLFEPSGAL